MARSRSEDDFPHTTTVLWWGALPPLNATPLDIWKDDEGTEWVLTPSGSWINQFGIEYQVESE